MKHRFEAISRVDVSVGEKLDGEPFVMEVPDSEEETVVGCQVCGMSLIDALRAPCPGMPVENVEG